jgi:hypothetical protein
MILRFFSVDALLELPQGRSLTVAVLCNVPTTQNRAREPAVI